MYKKILLIIITVLLIIGCDLFKKKGGDETDNSILLILKSKPVAENADTTVYLRYSASKGMLEEKDFLYSYTLSEVSGTTSAIIYKYPESGNGGPNYEAEFKKLKNGKSYIFKVKAQNPDDGAYSQELTYQFKIKNEYKFSYGIVSSSSNVYGESTGILKNGQTFKVYATLINSTAVTTESSLKSTNITLKLDLSDFSGATLSSVSKNEQSFEVNSTTGAIWEITAPKTTTTGSIKLEVVDTPYYKVSNLPIIDSSNGISIAAESRNPGSLVLSSFTTKSDTVVIGKTCDVTVVLKNEGDSSIVLSTAGVAIYNSLHNEITGEWTAAQSLNNLEIPGNTTITKTISYTVNSSDLGDVYLVFKGSGYEKVSKEAVKVESEQKTVFITSQ